MNEDQASGFLEYLSNQFDVQRVSGGSQAKLSGSPCPFCGEDRDDLRLYVNMGSGLGICHHCGTGFSPVKFIMAAEECSYQAALKVLAGDEDGFVSGDEPEDGEEPEEDDGAIWPQATPIADSPEALHYLRERGIPGPLCAHFGLYYSAQDTIIKGRTYYTAQRIVIPIYDQAGNPVSWQARDITGKAKTRYLFPPGFRGADYLYNTHTVPQGAKYVIMCEGAFDVYGWVRGGYFNTVGTFGKKVSPHQVEILVKLDPEVLFVAWDSDAKWAKAEFCEKYAHHFRAVRIIDLDGKDADEVRPSVLSQAIVHAEQYDWNNKILAAL